jgi:tetratricopeptide (TPR) repeat protein
VLERHFGGLRYVLIYFVAGVCGALLSLGAHWQHPVPCVGASGAGCGLVAAGAVAGHLLLGLDSTARRYRDAMLRWLLLIGVFSFMPGIDWAAHLGGAAAGAGVAWLMDRRIGALKRAQQRKKEGGIGLEAFVLVAVVGGCFALAARSKDNSFTAGELINQGVEKARAKDAEAAIALYRKALALDPNDDIGHYDLALALARTGRLAECAEHAREAARIEPSKNEYRELADHCGAMPLMLKQLDDDPDGGSDD